MGSDLILRTVSLDEVPRVKKQRTSKFNAVLVEAVNQLKDGQAAELDGSKYNVTTMRWYLNRLKREGIVRDAKIIIRKNGRNQKRAFLVKEAKA